MARGKATATARTKRRAARSSNGRPPQPRAGTLAQREMADMIAQRVVNAEQHIFNAEIARAERGEKDTDPCFLDGKPVMKEDHETQATYKERKERMREIIRNLEASFPTLMPLARKIMRQRRKELDEQE